MNCVLSFLEWSLEKARNSQTSFLQKKAEILRAGLLLSYSSPKMTTAQFLV